DVVGRLAPNFQARHKGSMYLALIDPTTPVARKIRDLRKKSKMWVKEELLLEYKRHSLRLSGTPWDLEAAKRIVTPASIYEDMSATEQDVQIKEDAKGLGLGSMSEPRSDTDKGAET